MDLQTPPLQAALPTQVGEGDDRPLVSLEKGQRARIAAFLGQVGIFAGLSLTERRRLAADMILVNVPSRTVLSDAATRGPGLGILWRGAAKISMPGHNGRQVILALLDPTDIFGELCLLEGEPGAAQVSALRRSQVIWLPTARFTDLLARHPEVGLRMLEITAQRIRAAEQRVRQLAFEDAPERIEATLREIARHRGEHTDVGIVLPRPSQRVLADMVGSTRETVNRAFKDLEARDVIRCNGRQVVLR